MIAPASHISNAIEVAPGATLLKAYLDPMQQSALAEQIQQLIEKSPLFVPHMPRSGKPMSVEMTNLGPLGWVTDKQDGYRYQNKHPLTGEDWPEIPPELAKIWDDVTGYAHPAEACLINYYGADAKMGLHRDEDEDDMQAPVLSLSLGDTALFRLGGRARTDKVQSVKLASGDVVMLAGAARLAFHGVSRIYAGSSRLLANGGRINLTLRRVTKNG